MPKYKVEYTHEGFVKPTLPSGATGTVNKVALLPLSLAPFEPFSTVKRELRVNPSIYGKGPYLRVDTGRGVWLSVDETKTLIAALQESID